jgi:CyaY protein
LIRHRQIKGSLSAASGKAYQGKCQCHDAKHDVIGDFNESDLSTRMNETEFINISNRVLEQMASAIDHADLDIDCSFKGEGILEIEFEDGTKFIINRNTPVREIWLAAPSGGFHFRADGDRWLDTRDGAELGSRVSALLKAKVGRDIHL